MALSKTVITLLWENGKSFEMKAKHGDAEAVSIISMQENSKTTQIWNNVASICNTYFSQEIDAIGEEMKKA